mgnify:FL=1|tara:strand:+ start:3218 stop:3571 length:354 start_codon:yes stop_codon:yes gene_type:complete
MTPLPLGTFSIDLIPELDEYHTWTGMLKINIVAEKRHLSALDASSYDSLMHLTQLVSCTVAYMERDPRLVHKLEEFMNEEDLQLNNDCDEEDKPKIEYSNDSNVVKLSFRTKTKGSA